MPRTKAARTWGGRGSGLPCNLCDSPILASEPEMELEFESTGSPKVMRLHLHCHAEWEAERNRPGSGDWTRMDQALPPFDTVVEARVTMPGGRPVILGVLRLRGGSGEAIWMNATTNSPLPEAWCPVEWRLPQALEPSGVLPKSTAPKRA